MAPANRRKGRLFFLNDTPELKVADWPHRVCCGVGARHSRLSVPSLGPRLAAERLESEFNIPNTQRPLFKIWNSRGFFVQWIKTYTVVQPACNCLGKLKSLAFCGFHAWGSKQHTASTQASTTMASFGANARQVQWLTRCLGFNQVSPVTTQRCLCVCTVRPWLILTIRASVFGLQAKAKATVPLQVA